ncbi:hypothetical protein FACS1894130_05770 [Spirochaetia bacterium]|nr:hypothetical protein FACS1894130_05770 [Spirochaetia bacterium]
MSLKKRIPFSNLLPLARLQAALLLATLLLASCASGPADVSDEITPAEVVQRAQEASDRNRYGRAMEYYQIILERFPSNIDMVCQAEYEIAFIHYKQKKYDIARGEFEALLTRYNTPDEELLPAQFKVLATNVLARIDEKEAKKLPGSKKENK